MNARVPEHRAGYPRNSRIFATELIGARDHRRRVGFLTVEEAAKRFGVAEHVIRREVDAARLASVTFTCADGDALFIPSKDGAAAEWLEAHR